METTDPLKICEFQEQRLRKSPTWGKKVAKISDFGGFPAEFDPNQCTGLPLRAKNTKTSL